jgi:hypothetical protein
MLCIDFEAAVQLKQWEDLGLLLDEAGPIAGDELYPIFADAVLCSGGSIVNKTMGFEVITTFIYS